MLLQMSELPLQLPILHLQQRPPCLHQAVLRLLRVSGPLSHGVGARAALHLLFGCPTRTGITLHWAAANITDKVVGPVQMPAATANHLALSEA